MGVFADLASIITRWRTWTLMANQDIQMRYRRSILGPFWISIALAALVFGIGLLYSQVQQQPFEEFLTFFGCGMLAWTMFAALVNEGSNLVIDAESHLRNLPLPLPLLAARIVYRNYVILAHNVLVVGAMLMLIGHPPDATAFLALPAILLYAPLGIFWALAFGPMCARFRDMPQIISSILQVAFFLTPIFWVPGSSMERTSVLQANPLYHLVEIVRRPLLGEPATELNWIVSLALVAMLGVMAMISLATTRKRLFLWL